jgi:ligand-binding sensor domain-containing protein/two-component sensor histidine kinase
MTCSGPFRTMMRSVPGIQNCIHWLRALSWFAGILLVLFASPLSTSGQAMPFTRTIWRSRDGFPESGVQALAQDRNGYLWVGTTGGLTRFDGARFSPLIDVSNQTPSINSFDCLLLARDGTLWAGTDGGGLLHITGPAVSKTYAAPDGLTGAFIHSIYEDSRNRLWVGTDSGLFLKEGEQLVRVDQPAANAPFDVQAIVEDHEHHILAGGSRLISIGIGQIRNISMPGSQRLNQVNAILEATDRTLWVGTASGLLHRVHGGFQRVPEIAAAVRTLRQASDGTVWIGTIGKGLWAYRNGIFTRIGDKGLYPIDTVHSIFEDADHRLWIGTQNGLVRLVKSQIRVIPLPGFGNANNYGAVSGAPNGDIWVIAQEAFRVSRTKAIRATFPGLQGAPIRSIYSAKDGSTWVGTKGRGVYHLAGSATTPFSNLPRHFAMNGFIRGFLESSRGEMWIATDDGLYCIGAKGTAYYRTADGLANLSVRSLFEDRDHDIWIGTDHGLSRWHAGAFVQDAATATLRDEKVWSVLQDRRGTMWFGTRDHGLFRYRGNSIDHYTTARGLMSNIVYQILQDRTGRFWISSEETISSVPEEDMDGDPPGQNRLLGVTLYRMPYEADGALLSGGRYPSGYLAPDDTVWFSSNRGAVHVFANSRDVERAPAAKITGITRDGENIQLNDDLQLPAGSTRLTFSFASLFLGPEDGTRFSYRLDNFDHAWTFGGSGRTASYTNLPAGTYRFRVQAFDISHPDVTTEATLSFRQRPFLYQILWFRVVCLLALLGCGILVYTVNFRRERMHFAAVLEERGRLAREMHDTLIQGCTGVSLLLEVIATQREDAPEHSDLLDTARAQILATINEARDAVWNLRRKEEEEIDLSHSLAALAEQSTRAFGIPVVCERVDPISGISGSTGHELLMVAHEAIANAGTHGHPDWIRISASLEGIDLTLTVIDNGSGFTEAILSDTTGEHYGLVGMRERMHRIGGTLLIHSESGRGTEVVMRLRHAPRWFRAPGRRSRGILR